MVSHTKPPRFAVKNLQIQIKPVKIKPENSYQTSINQEIIFLGEIWKIKRYESV